ncbi:hypothetical protein EXS73_01885 [Candidatus Pacearchaeota archaeon]|nr:hypothetical protein [Candidatus Pacearchaeota archaeon]
MTDIFDTAIFCKSCTQPMKQTVVHRDGFELRAVQCGRCKDTIIHPADTQSMHQFQDLKGKTFHVKLRMVGNSHAISIPKEIVDFMHDHHRTVGTLQTEMDDIVRLCFEDFHRLSVRFGEEGRYGERN